MIHIQNKITGHKRSYFYRMLIPFALVFIMTIGIASLFSYSYISRNLKQKIHGEVVSLSDTIAQFVKVNVFSEPYRCLLDKFLGTGQYNEIPMFFYGTEKPSNIDLYNLQSHLKKSLYSYKYIQTLSVYAVVQDLLIVVNEGYHTEFLTADNSQASLTSLKEVIGTNLNHIEPNEFYYHTATSELFVINPLPVYARQQDAVGFFITKIDLGTLLADIDLANNTANYSIALTDTGFETVIWLENPYAIETGLLSAAATSDAAIHQQTASHGDYLVCRRDIDATDMVLTIMAPYDMINQEAGGFTRNLAYISFAVLFVLLLIIYFISQYLYQPIKNIVKTLSIVQKSCDRSEPLSDIEFINQSVNQLSARLESMNEIIIDNQNMIEYRLMMDLIHNKSTSEDSFFKTLSLIGKKHAHRCYFIVVLDLAFSPDHSATAFKKYEYLRIKLQSLLDQNYSEHLLANIIYSANSIVMLFHQKNPDSNKSMAKEIFSSISQSVTFPFNLAVSDSFDNILLTHEYYTTTENMLKYAFLCGYRNIFTSETLSNYERNHYIVSSEKIQLIEAKLNSGKTADLKSFLSMLTNEMRAGCSIESVTSSLTSITNITLNCMQKKGNRFSDDDSEQIKRSLLQARHIDDYMATLYQACDIFSEIQHDEKDDLFYENLIEEVITYIESNLQNDISLNTLALHFNLSQGYLSKRFKKHTGTSFSKYIIDKKMEKAASLIRHDNNKIKDPAYPLD